MQKNIFIALFAAMLIMPMSNAYIIKPQCTGSMEPTITCGDLISVSKHSEYYEGDIVGTITCEYSEEWRTSHNGVPMLMKKKYCTPYMRLLHRIAIIEGNNVVTIGDKNTWMDAPITKSEILFKVDKIIRNKTVIVPERKFTEVSPEIRKLMFDK